MNNAHNADIDNSQLVDQLSVLAKWAIGMAMAGDGDVVVVVVVVALLQ
jgi:hypothetical protein